MYTNTYAYASRLTPIHIHSPTVHTHALGNKDIYSKCDSVFAGVRVTLHVGWETEDPDIAAVRALALNQVGAF